MLDQNLILDVKSGIERAALPYHGNLYRI